jgi:hypothetical protein
MIDLALDNEIKLVSRSNLYACKSKTKSNFSIESRSTYCMQMRETKETLKFMKERKTSLIAWNPWAMESPWWNEEGLMSLRSWKYGRCKQAHPILQANEILYASQNLQKIVKLLVSPTRETQWHIS